MTMIAADGTLLYDSPSVTRLLGYASTERLGRKVFEFVHPDERREGPWGSPLLSSSQRNTTDIRAFPSQRWRTTLDRGSRRSNLLHEPTVQAIVVNYRDITERKRLRTLPAAPTGRINAAGEGICVTGPNEAGNMLLYVNHGFELFDWILGR